MTDLTWKREREKRIAETICRDGQCDFVEMRESPDAELRGATGERIGLEVVSVVDEMPLNAERRMADTTKAVEKQLTESGLQCCLTVGFDLAAFDPRKEDEKSHRRWFASLDLVPLLATRPHGVIQYDALRAAGIDRIAWLSWEPSEVPRALMGYRRDTPPGETLVDACLAKKHAKLLAYRQKNHGQFDLFWLAFDGFGPGTAEDGGFMMLLRKTFQTSYDRVFLMMRDGAGGFASAKDVTPPQGRVDARITD